MSYLFLMMLFLALLLVENGKWQVVGTSDDLILQGSNFECAFVAIGNCRIRKSTI
jgi:hypothetical protein